MKLGIKALQFSANAALGRSERMPAREAAAQGSSRPGPWPANLIFSLAFFIFLYKFVPLYLATRLGKVYPVLQGRMAFNLADGVIRIAIFLAFLYVLSRMKDIRRVFEYHGAEHKVVFNFESGKPVNGGERAEVRHLPSALRHQLSVRGDDLSHAGLHADSVRWFPAEASLPHRAAAGDRGRELRADPLRRQAARIRSWRL